MRYGGPEDLADPYQNQKGNKIYMTRRQKIKNDVIGVFIGPKEDLVGPIAWSIRIIFFAR